MWGARVLRPTACVVLVAFTGLTLQPLTAAAQLPAAPKRAHVQVQAETGDERYSRVLAEIYEILKQVAPRAATPPALQRKGAQKDLRAVGPNMRIEAETDKPLPGIDAAAKIRTLREKLKDLKSLGASVETAFQATGDYLRDKAMPSEIVARHEAALAEYKKRKGEFEGLAQVVENANDPSAAIESLARFMAKYQQTALHAPINPKSLPSGTPPSVTRQPYTSPAQFRTSRLFGETTKVAQAGSLSGIVLPNVTLPVLPNAGDVAATDEVQITQAIRNLATNLGNDPVKIYAWVRNNVDFIPTYGSIQGSDMTLAAKRGNAFDTASLLIALLRAANVPARYVYGTVQVPAGAVMNWIGGATTPGAAIDLMNQGGIPTIGVASAGQLQAIRFEHVWVEAFVDYVPSRGAVNRVPDSWVPMDASFKQYQYKQGMDLKTNVPFDAQSFQTQILQGALVNETEGWVQNVNQAAIQQSVIDYQARLSSYITGQSPTATVGDVLGSRSIVPDDRQILLGTLPYVRIATGAKFQEMPDNIRHKFVFTFYASQDDVAFESPAFTYTRSLPALAGKKVALVYEAATPADQTVLTNAANNLGSSVPAYLVNLRPALKVEGVTEAVGPASTMGTRQVLNVQVQAPWYQHDRNYMLTSGDLSVFGINPAGITPELYNGRVAANRLTSAGHPDFTAEMFYQIALGWWAEKYAMNDVVAAGNKVLQHQLPSHAVAGAPLTVRYFFGVPRSATYASRTLDGKEDAVIVAHVSGDQEMRRQTVVSMGRIGSYLESGIYDQAFLSEKGLSVSSMTALGAANAGGLKIYTIDQFNASMLDRIVTAPEDLDDMRNAVAAGMRVTVSERDVVIGNYTGLGYIIEDPITGAAAYLVSGGRNGNNSPAQQNAYPLPRIPANGAHTFLIGAAQRTSPAGSSMPILVAEGSILGVAVPAPGPGAAVAAAILLLLILLLILLKMLRDLLDRTSRRLEPELVVRHYTGRRFVPNPFITNRYILGSPSGTSGPGVYMTEETAFWVPPGPPLRGVPGPLLPGQTRETAGCPVSSGLSGTMGFVDGILTLTDPGSIQYYLELQTAWFDNIPRVNDAWVELRFSRTPPEAEPSANSKGANEWVFKRPQLIVAPNLPPLPVLLLEEADSFDYCAQ